MAKRDQQDRGARSEERGGDSAVAVEEPRAEEAAEWTPQSYAEFLASDLDAVKTLSEAIASYRIDEGIPGPELRVPQPTQRKLLGCGETCVWFEAADDTRTPLLAFVLGNDGVDMVALEVRFPDGARKVFHGVLRLGSERFSKEPQHIRNGAWDEPLAAEMRRAERHARHVAAQAKIAAARKEKQQADRELREAQHDQLIAMIASGTDFDTACQKLGPHWTIDLALTHWKRTGRALPRQTVA